LRSRSVDGIKQRRIVRAAQHYLMWLPVPTPVPLRRGGGQIHWVKSAFDAG
jgi:Holliday junction resolvase-like predicted endonuclease